MKTIAALIVMGVITLMIITVSNQQPEINSPIPWENRQEYHNIVVVSRIGEQHILTKAKKAHINGDRIIITDPPESVGSHGLCYVVVLPWDSPELDKYKIK